jgi:hypothetical protein
MSRESPPSGRLKRTIDVVLAERHAFDAGGAMAVTPLNCPPPSRGFDADRAVRTLEPPLNRYDTALPRQEAAAGPADQPGGTDVIESCQERRRWLRANARCAADEQLLFLRGLHSQRERCIMIEDGDTMVPLSAATIVGLRGEVASLDSTVDILVNLNLQAEDRTDAAEAERDFLKRRNEGLQAFVEKLQVADAAERDALLQCPTAEIRRLLDLPRL